MTLSLMWMVMVAGGLTGRVTNRDHVERSRRRIDARKLLLSKVALPRNEPSFAASPARLHRIALSLHSLIRSASSR
jgi:hypothetical protein